MIKRRMTLLLIIFMLILPVSTACSNSKTNTQSSADKSSDESNNKKLSEEEASVNPPSGCRFHTRCPYAENKCHLEEPKMKNYKGRLVACHYILQQLYERINLKLKL